MTRSFWCASDGSYLDIIGPEWFVEAVIKRYGLVRVPT